MKRKPPVVHRLWALVQRSMQHDVKRMGLCLRDASAAAGLPKPSLHAVLRRDFKRRPSRKTLDRLAGAAWVSPRTRRGLNHLRACAV